MLVEEFEEAESTLGANVSGAAVEGEERGAWAKQRFGAPTDIVVAARATKRQRVTARSSRDGSLR